MDMYKWSLGLKCGFVPCVYMTAWQRPETRGAPRLAPRSARSSPPAAGQRHRHHSYELWLANYGEIDTLCVVFQEKYYCVFEWGLC